MIRFDHPDFLRNVLLLDAATGVGAGALMAFGTGPVASMTLLPAGLLTLAGLALFPVAAFMAFVALKRPLWTAGVWTVVIGNLGWVLASVGLLATGAVAPNALGVLFVLAQAATVAVLAGLEYAGLTHRPLAA